MDLYRDIVFGARVVRAEYREPEGDWQVETEDGDRYRCRYLVSAGGILSVPVQPAFDGLETFAGDWYMSSRWPANASPSSAAEPRPCRYCRSSRRPPGT